MMILENNSQEQVNLQPQEPYSSNSANSAVSAETPNQENVTNTKNRFSKLLLVTVISIIILTLLILIAFNVWSANLAKKAITPEASNSPSQELTIPVEELAPARDQAGNIFFAAEVYKQTELGNGKYPASLTELKKNDLLEETALPEGVTYAYASTRDGEDCELKFSFSNSFQTTNTCLSFADLDAVEDGVFKKTPEELAADKKVQEKLPYVAALSDVEMIFSAVSRYRAFNSANPTSIQQLIDSGELISAFEITERAGYTLEYSANTEAETQVVVRFENGHTITAKYDDPNFGDEFAENYPSKE